LAAELQKDFDVQAQLIPGRGGIFNVHVDDKLIFSKNTVDRFPAAGEVTKLIRKLPPKTKKA
jgi:selT/selW/selH-like putative selenoprotein